MEQETIYERVHRKVGFDNGLKCGFVLGVMVGAIVAFFLSRSPYICHF